MCALQICKLTQFREFAQELGNVQLLLSPENGRIPDEEREIIRRYHMARLEALAVACLPSKEERERKGTSVAKE